MYTYTHLLTWLFSFILLLCIVCVYWFKYFLLTTKYVFSHITTDFKIYGSSIDSKEKKVLCHIRTIKKRKCTIYILILMLCLTFFKSISFSLYISGSFFSICLRLFISILFSAFEGSLLEKAFPQIHRRDEWGADFLTSLSRFDSWSPKDICA